MPQPNSLNTGKGRYFQQGASVILAEHFKCGKFALDYSHSIGNPPKEHKFDLASEDGRFVGECKNFSWTDGGNIPSGKIAKLNEAVLFLSFLPPANRRFIAMRRDVRPMHKESLAEYYHRINAHLLRGIEIVEVDLNAGTARKIGSSSDRQAREAARALAAMGGTQRRLRQVRRRRW
jgi:hypothetical protein